MLPLTLALVALVGAVALAYSLRRDANTQARHATRETPTAQKRPGWGEGSRIPEGAFSIHDYETES
jgi:hypothetical protein